MWRNYNPNPKNARVGDCTVRAISKVLNQDWQQTYVDLCLYGFTACDMPSSNAVWGKYLTDKGFKRKILCENFCDNYTVKDFADEHKKGIYVLAMNGHVVAVCDGDYFDTWDSGSEIPIYFWEVNKDDE